MSTNKASTNQYTAQQSLPASFIHCIILIIVHLFVAAVVVVSAEQTPLWLTIFVRVVPPRDLQEVAKIATTSQL